MKWYEVLAGVAITGIVGISGYAFAQKYFGSKTEDESIPNEPFATGTLDIQRETGTNTESITSRGGAITPPVTGSDSLGVSGVGTNQTLTIPLDRTSEYAARLTPDIKEVKLISPLVYVKDDGTAILDAMQELVVNRTAPEGTQQSIVYVDKDGNRYNSEQELFNAFVRMSSAQGILDAAQGSALSVQESINRGIPINVTNVITSRPKGFPEASPDAISPEFQRRARALQKSLTATNPGASSNAGLANFSRLAAVGTDLSKVDLYNVRNPNYIANIKGKPLSREQQVLLDQMRLRIDKRNMTSSDFAEIARNQQTGAQARALLAVRAKQLTQAGYNEQQAKTALATKGIKVTGSLSPQQFAALEQRLGTGVTQACLNCTVKPTTSVPTTTVDKRNQERINQFLRQTGRSNLNNLTAAEKFALDRLLAA